MNMRYLSQEGPVSVEARMQEDIIRQDADRDMRTLQARRRQRWDSLQMNRAVRGVGATVLAGIVVLGSVASYFRSENASKQEEKATEPIAALVNTPPADREALLRKMCDADPTTIISGVLVCETIPTVPTADSDNSFPEDPVAQNP